MSTVVNPVTAPASQQLTNPNPYTASLLPRSTIAINPFSSIRRRLSHCRSGTEQTQLFEEFTQSLDDYIAAFAPTSLELRADGTETTVSNDPLGPCPARLNKKDLLRLAEELDSTVLEITDKYPDFRHCLITGAYGPFFLPTTNPMAPDSERFQAHEPSYAEFVNGQWWALRLRKDLCECIPPSLHTATSPNASVAASLSTPASDRIQPGLYAEDRKTTDAVRYEASNEEGSVISTGRPDSASPPINRARSASSYRSASLLVRSRAELWLHPCRHFLTG